MNFYNEIDPFAASWLRELIKAGHIAPGIVDERSIEDITPNELTQYTQCHFFAGIGVWSYALRQAGWFDDRRVWTGSCPCQPFSSAGKRGGTSDERHLWPAWFHLIEKCRPPVLFGEQVEAAVRHGWLDLVQNDLENCGYSVGAVGIPAAGFGAPHIRQRLYFVADALRSRAEHRPYQGVGAQAKVDEGDRSVSGERLRFGVEGATGILANPRQQPTGRGLRRPAEGVEAPSERTPDQLERPGEAGDLGHAADTRRSVARKYDGGPPPLPPRFEQPSLTNGFWADAEWLWCRDGKYRPVEPGTFPLAHGATSRVGRLRGYGNALVAPQASAFISAYLETERES